MARIHPKVNRSIKCGKDDEPAQERPKFPTSAFCVLGSKLFEYFAFSGARAVLLLYLTLELSYSTQHASIIYHGLIMGIYLMCIVGAILADSFLGKYRTVLYMSFASAIGILLINLSSFTAILNLPSIRTLTFIGLVLISVGSGCLKPCLIALGADQFRQPQQERQLSKYYSLIYVVLSLSILCASAFAPLLRNDIQCFGNDHCFPAAFGVSSASILIAIGILLLGRNSYVKKLPKENMLIQVSSCVWEGASLWLRNRNSNPKSHWLDHAEAKFGPQLVNEIKALLNVTVLFLPIPIIWTLNDQTGSLWTLQATTLNGDLGFYTIKPDQMQMSMPLLVLVFIVVCDTLIYPFVGRFGVNGPLRRMVLGSFMYVFAFIIAGILQFRTEPTAAILPSPGYCQVRLYNSVSWDVNTTSNAPELNNIWLPSMDTYQVDVRVMDDQRQFNLYFENNSNNCHSDPVRINLTAGTSMGIWLQDSHVTEFEESPRKDITGLASLRILLNDPIGSPFTLIDLDRRNQTRQIQPNPTSPQLMLPSRFRITSNDTLLADLTLGPGSVTTILSRPSNGTYISSTIEITPPNTVHMLWMLPQYIFLAMGETIVGVTGLNFAYTEAPESMKSVLQALWLLTISMGNLIDMIILGINIFRTPAVQSFFFAALMALDIVLFMWLVKRYRRVDCGQLISE